MEKFAAGSLSVLKTMVEASEGGATSIIGNLTSKKDIHRLKKGPFYLTFLSFILTCYIHVCTVYAACWS